MIVLMEKLLSDDKMEIIIQKSREFTSCPTAEGKGSGQQKAVIVDPLLFLTNNDIDDNDEGNDEPNGWKTSTAHNIPYSPAARQPQSFTPQLPPATH